MEKLAQWTVIALPALAMWVPVGAEVWLLLVLVTMVVAWLTGWRPQSGIWGREQKTIAWALVAMVGIKALSLLWSIAPAFTWHHVKLHLHLLLYVPLLVLFSQTREVDKLFFNKTLPLAIVLGAVWAAWAWGQSGYVLSGIEFAGATKNSLILSIFLTFVICNVFFAWLQRPKLGAVFLIGLALFTMMVNGKRSTGLVTLAVMLIASILHWQVTSKSSTVDRPRNLLPWAAVIAIFIVMSVVLLGLTWSNWVLAMQQAQQFLTSGYAGGSVDTRLELYGVGLQSFFERPVLGHGAGTAKAVIATSMNAQGLASYNHYHQLIIQLLADLGVTGLFIWIAALLFIQRALNRCTQHAQRLQLTAYTTVMIMLSYGLTNLSFGNILTHILFVYMLALSSANFTDTSESSSFVFLKPK